MMKNIVDFLNEGFITEKYDKEILQDILTALSKPDIYSYFNVVFCNEDGHAGYFVVENVDKDQQKKFVMYLVDSTDFIEYIEPQKQYEIEESLDFCRTMPSTFYCCEVTFDDENKTRGYLFANVEKGAEKRSFEKFLNKHLDNVNVL